MTNEAFAHVRTERLWLDVPTPDDVEQLHAILSDPRVWTHLPSGRFTDRSETERTVQAWGEGWRDHGLGTWVVRDQEGGPVVGYCGCSVRANTFWNLGYRFDASTHGRGYATEAGGCVLEAAQRVRPDLPVVASLLEHNVASRTVAERLGLVLRVSASDAGNPDPTAVRLVLADRPLDAAQQAVILH